MTPDPKETDLDFAERSVRSLDAIEPSASLLRRVAEIPVRHEHQARLWYWPFGALWQPAVGLVAVVLLGIFAGSSVEVPEGELAAQVVEGQADAGAGVSSASPEESELNAFDELLGSSLGAQWQDESWLEEETL